MCRPGSTLQLFVVFSKHVTLHHAVSQTGEETTINSADRHRTSTSSQRNNRLLSICVTFSVLTFVEVLFVK